MKILIIHGPNMNLLGLRSASKGKKVTLDKVNRHIRRYIRNKGIEIKIIQAHDENKVVSYLHRNRNKFDGIICVSVAPKLTFFLCFLGFCILFCFK